LPEPGGELLVSQRIERPQDDPYERRFLRDGAVWERTSSEARVVDGELVFDKVPLEWRQIAQLPQGAVRKIEEAARGVLDLPAEQAPPGTSTGGAIVTYDVAAAGREHTVKLINLAPNEVPGVAELDMAMQLAVAQATSPG
jgi:hypothetical protein